MRLGSSEQILKQDVHQDLNNIIGDSLLYQWHGLQKNKKALFFSPWICTYWPKKVCVWSPSFPPRGWHQEVDSRKVVRHCKPAFVSILLPSRNFNLKPRHLGRISTQFCKAKESRHTVPSWTGKAASTEDFQLQSHYWSSGLKADLFKLTQSQHWGTRRLQGVTWIPKPGPKQFCAAQSYRTHLYPALPLSSAHIKLVHWI